ncbi:hypothetical protein [Fredinandcohnia sp. 179-A 10B2 NHS]|uniref:hypothetical protein n=1 Tax=Fredinandcohnia sp. 179-A 10B2 NHS TaxID=3235176 RepID=UPI0039A059C2
MSNQVDHIIKIIKELKESPSKGKKLNLDKFERVVGNVDSFSESCEECQKHMLRLENHIIQVKENVGTVDETITKQHKQFISSVTSHLHKKHKLVSEGTYFTTFMSIGISLGVASGLTMLDNIGLGIAFGMSIGTAIGIAMDEDAKKKGKMI